MCSFVDNLVSKKWTRANILSFNRLIQMCTKFLKSCIRETKHLLTDVDSSTDTKIGWTNNTQKPDFFEKRKKSSITQKLKNV